MKFSQGLRFFKFLARILNCHGNATIILDKQFLSNHAFEGSSKLLLGFFPNKEVQHYLLLKQDFEIKIMNTLTRGIIKEIVLRKY